MRIGPQTYIMTDTDTTILVDHLGWEIENNSNLSVNDFVNSFFLNFNICKFLDEVDHILANHCSSKIIKKLKFEEVPLKYGSTIMLKMRAFRDIETEKIAS